MRAVAFVGAGDNFCSGGDAHEIIGPLVRLKAPELLMFTRMTGDLVKAMRTCPQPIVAAVDGLCAAAGPTFANGITKTMLHQEWAVTIEQAIEAEAQAQVPAICMLTEDFSRAHPAFVAKSKPRFEGN